MESQDQPPGRKVLDYRKEMLRKFRTALKERNWDLLMLLGDKLRAIGELQKREKR